MTYSARWDGYAAALGGDAGGMYPRRAVAALADGVEMSIDTWNKGE